MTTNNQTIPIRVALVEDDPKFRARVDKALAAAAPRVELTHVPFDGEGACLEIQRLRPDVVLMDIQLPQTSGIELVRRLAPSLPGTKFMMLTVMADYDRIYDAICAGALGYLLKREVEDSLLSAILNLHAGGSPMTNSIARKVLEALQKPKAPAPQMEGLTNREHEILVELAKGHTYKEVAAALGVEFDTVRTHVHNMYRKLQVRKRAEAVSKLNATASIPSSKLPAPPSDG